MNSSPPSNKSWRPFSGLDGRAGEARADQGLEQEPAFDCANSSTDGGGGHRAALNRSRHILSTTMQKIASNTCRKTRSPWWISSTR